jgi:Zn-dependent protease
MIISLLYTQPLLFFIWLLAITYGITVHEFSHVLAARLQGDDTGERMGRLTLNPLAHIDLLGFAMLLFAGFGWGRPAPYNPYNLKFRKWGEVLVALAGPLSNLISIVVFGTVARLAAPSLGAANLFIQFLDFLILINIVLLVFNLIPIPPLDGSQLLFRLLPARAHHIKVYLAKNGPWLLLVLIIADNFLGINIFGGLFDFFLSIAGKFF